MKDQDKKNSNHDLLFSGFSRIYKSLIKNFNVQKSLIIFYKFIQKIQHEKFDFDLFYQLFIDIFIQELCGLEIFTYSV